MGSSDDAVGRKAQLLEEAESLAHFGCFEWDIARDRVLWSDELYRLYGMAPGAIALTRDTFLERVHPDDRARVGATIGEALSTCGAFQLEERIVWPDGTVRLLESRAKVVADGEGRAARLLGVCRDITAQRQGELALRESEARLRTFVDHASDAFYVHDHDGRLLDVNRQACESLAMTRDEIVGRYPRDIDPDITDDTMRALLERLDRGEGFTFESRHRRRDGATFDVEIMIRPFYSDGARRALSQVRDITDRKRLEAQLRQAQKMEAVGRLAGGIAHDLNNLLTVIQSCGGLLEANVPPESPGRELLDEIHGASERAEWLTRQLLSFSRRAVVKPARLDVSALLRDTQRLLARLIGEDIVIRAELAEALPPVMADRGQFEQVVMNLALNARDAMPDGGTLTLRAAEVRCERADLAGESNLAPGRYVEVMVRDTGHGMSDEVRAKIFEPFFTTKAVGKGTGLGLAVVHGAVVQTGGFVRVESRVGEGTTFRLLFPASEPEPVAAAPAAAPSPAATRGGETLLLVEDEPDVRKVARRVLEARGYKVLAASNGHEALEVLREHAGPVDLLVTDLVMPGMNGRELVTHARAVRSALPVLYMSGYTGDTVVRFGLPDVSDAFLQKPFTSNALGLKVREVLDARDGAATP